MPDIAMCQNNVCPHAKNCYRYMAKPDEYWQSYMKFDWRLDNCHWPLEHATGEVRDANVGSSSSVPLP